MSKEIKNKDIVEDLEDSEGIIELANENSLFQEAIMPFFQVGLLGKGGGINGLDILAKMGDGGNDEDMIRMLKYLDYDKMEIDLPEVHVGLNIYADIITMGTEGDDKAFEIETTNKRVKKILTDLIDRVDLYNKTNSIARDVKKYGDDYEEIITNESETQIDRLRNLSVYTMYRNEDSQGKLTSFKQKDFSGKTIATFSDPKQIIHLRYKRPRNLMPLDAHSHIYGRSMLYPLQRIAPLMVSIEEGMVVGRLYRSHDRFKIIIDCTGLDDKKTKQRLKMYKKMFRRKNLYNPATGQLNLSKLRIIGPEEDFFIGAHKDGVTPDVQTVAGQATLGNIEDVRYFQNKVFAVLGIPKAYFSVEGEINAKATLVTEDTQFGRTVKKDQSLIASSLVKRVCDYELNLKGFNTTKKNLYNIIFAKINMEDESRKIDIMASEVDVGLSLLEAGVIDKEYMALKYAKIPVEDFDKFKNKLPKKTDKEKEDEE